MRHQKKRTRLANKPAHGRMLKRNLITSLILYESIRTTKKRAQAVQPEIDRLVTYAKSHSPHIAIRHINRTVTDKNASRKVMEVFVKRYAKRASGLSRIVPAGSRKGDGAEIVDLTLIDAEVNVAEEKPAEEKKETVKAEEKKPEKEEKKPAAKKTTAKKAAPKKDSKKKA